MHHDAAVTQLPQLLYVCTYICTCRYSSMAALSWNLSQNSEYLTLCASYVVEMAEKQNGSGRQACQKLHTLDQTKSVRQELLLSKSHEAKRHGDCSIWYSTLDLRCLNYPLNVSSNWCHREYIFIPLTFNWWLCHSNFHEPNSNPGFELVPTFGSRKALLIQT